MPHGALFDLRRKYHQQICGTILGTRVDTEALTVADKDSKTSVRLAQGMADRIGLPLCKKPDTSQTAGRLFTEFTCEFLKSAFGRLGHLRPGHWVFSVSQAKPGIAAFDQYEHLATLQTILRKIEVEHPEVKSAFAEDYLITPDIVIARKPVEDVTINEVVTIIQPEDGVARFTPFRQANRALPVAILHASISCKWTMRSDRSQNTRTEALNLIRNRKGRTPHIAAVTMEPLPTRLASIALGTGDVDCTYHAALHELVEAAHTADLEDQAEMLDTMVAGKRLRDISDLPFDLAV